MRPESAPEPTVKVSRCPISPDLVAILTGEPPELTEADRAWLAGLPEPLRCVEYVRILIAQKRAVLVRSDV